MKTAPAKAILTLRINGETRDAVVPVHKTLLEVLREDLGLTGTKHGCELGECGTCTVLVGGTPVLSCLTLPVEVQDEEITTVEGLAQGWRLHPLQTAFAELGAAQCGYCTPGMLLAAKALLDREPAPAREVISAHLAGNLCRCTGYLKILEAVEMAAARMRGDEPQQPGTGTQMPPVATGGPTPLPAPAPGIPAPAPAGAGMRPAQPAAHRSTESRPAGGQR